MKMKMDSQTFMMIPANSPRYRMTLRREGFDPCIYTFHLRASAVRCSELAFQYANPNMVSVVICPITN